MNVNGLFPVPVALIEERPPTKDELLYIINKEKRDNKGNIASTDTHILNREELSGLRSILEFHVNDFFFKVLAVDIKCKLKITQSWCNYTESDQFHHVHAHSNSAVSGVYYPQAEHPEDSLTFYSPSELNQLMLPSVYESNPFNSYTWWLPAKTGSIILFPSYLYHAVTPIKDRDSTRISLSFNTFYEGHLGNEEELTSLEIKTCM
jgi:uncharacterized protein (TIGR02466 family)